MTAAAAAPIRIALAEDHGVVREALRALLGTEPGFEVVGECSDGLAAVELVDRLQPDVLVLDLMMPGLDGIQATRQVHKRRPATRVVILSMHLNEAHLHAALTSGAAGYVRKQGASSELFRAIHDVSRGKMYLSPPFSEKAVRAYGRKTGEAVRDPYDSLTEREQQVLHLTAEGLSHAEVAERLGISPRTAETHRAHVAEKLGLRRQIDLVRYAIRRGIIALDQAAPDADGPAKYSS